MNKKIKLHRFIDCAVPVHLCNFRCHYCYILQHKLFDNYVKDPDHSPEEFGKALSIKRMGGICLFNFCGGGETLLMSRFLDYAYEVLKQGHYIMIVTNGTCFDKFEQMKKWPKDYIERTFFKFSYHYQQLKEKKLLDKYFQNISDLRKLGFSFTVELVPYDELIPLIDDIISYPLKYLGALPHVTVSRDETKAGLPILTSLSKEEYYKTWCSFNSKLFEFKYSIFNVKRKEFCFAGLNSCYLSMATGTATQCYCSYRATNIYNRKFNFPGPIGYKCAEEHCYNGHAWLTFGNIPGLETPTYLEMRDRKSSFGYNWVNDKMAFIMSQKIHVKHACLSKIIWNIKNFVRLLRGKLCRK